MSSKAKRYLFAFFPIALMTPLGLFVGTFAKLTGVSLWVLRLGFVLLGAIAGAVVFWFLKRGEDESDQAPSGSGDSKIDDVMAEARRKIGAASGPKKASFRQLPMVIVLGRPGSTKTTSIVRSGLEPELLAGEVLRGDVVPPTDGVNVWYSQDTLFVEAGGAVTLDASRWDRLSRWLHPRRVGAVLARGSQAARVALVCVSCEDLLEPQAATNLPAVARDLRARLVESARDLGIRLPVYVLFTKADRIPHFEDFVRNFSQDEARRVLGVTLPTSGPVQAGAYGDQEFTRLTGAYQRLYRSLAVKRLRILPRENEPDRTARAYEFPRELGKIRDLAVSFMVDLCRPSELQVSPFLRGFYFTGVRPIVVSESAAPPPPLAPQGGSGSVEATRVFDALAAQRSAAPPPATPGGSRRVPQWVFLERLLKDVILRDEVARGISQGGSKVNAWRRRLLIAAAATAVLFSVGQTVSFFRNRGTQTRVLASVESLRTVVSDEVATAPLGSLLRLDTLRQHTATLARWEREGPPFFHRWGLYAGSSTYRVARQAYFDTFDELLFQRTRAAIAGSLGSLPSQPSEDSDYGESYDLLKAYLVTTIHPERSTAAFLAPTLLRQWRGNERMEEERQAVARRQFDFYAEELALDNPYPEREADGSLVSQARRFLLEFGRADPFYRSLVADADADAGTSSIRVNSSVLVDTFEVRGAFTKEGWAFVEGRLADPESLLKTEEWVLGPGAPVPDPAELVQQITSAYRTDFARQWQGFLGSASVVSFSDARDAARKLNRLADNESPLLDLLLVVSEQTAAGSEDVVGSFQPVYTLAPADSVGEVTAGNAIREYLSGLASIGSAMEEVGDAEGDDQDAAVEEARSQIVSAKQMLLDVTQDFDARTDLSRPVAASLRRLLATPIDEADRVLGGLLVELPTRSINERGVVFCRDFDRIVASFPFRLDPNASEASLEDIAAAFHPENSTLWNFYNQALTGLMERRGNRYVARSDANVTVTPSFVAFIDRAASISRTLYPDGGERPQMELSFRPRFSNRIEELTLLVDGVSNRFTPVSNQTLVLTWDGEPSQVRLLGRVDGVERTLLGPFEGTWAAFRLLLAADDWIQAGSRYTVQWSIPVPGTPNLQLEADVEAPPAFANGDFTALRCPGQVAR
jgi:type VI secretion system protein ImpL